jgi:hypothetical protein
MLSVAYKPYVLSVVMMNVVMMNVVVLSVVVLSVVAPLIQPVWWRSIEHDKA